jgi:glycogen debranching enzyme
VVRAVEQELLTSYGLRSLSPADPAYVARCEGAEAMRDGAYHQGTAWSWLLGPLAEAHFAAFGDPASAAALLAPIEDHLGDAGLGSISEVFDGEAPHTPRGCPAQAWGVGETLRVTRLLRESASRGEACLRNA